MAKLTNRVYSRHSQEAVALLGKLIKAARKEHKMTTLELAERAGISRSLLQRIEKGDPKCGLGSTFEVAAIVGVDLFPNVNQPLTQAAKDIDRTLTLLPKTVRKKSRKAHAGF